MAPAGNLAASIAEEARNRSFMPHADSGWPTLKPDGKDLDAPFPPWVATSRIAGENSGHGSGLCANDPFSNRLSQCQPPELNAVRADLGQVVLRLLRKPAFGAASENLG